MSNSSIFLRYINGVTLATKATSHISGHEIHMKNSGILLLHRKINIKIGDSCLYLMLKMEHYKTMNGYGISISDLWAWNCRSVWNNVKVYIETVQTGF